MSLMRLTRETASVDVPILSVCDCGVIRHDREGGLCCSKANAQAD